MSDSRGQGVSLLVLGCLVHVVRAFHYLCLDVRFTWSGRFIACVGMSDSRGQGVSLLVLGCLVHVVRVFHYVYTADGSVPNADRLGSVWRF